MKLATVSPTSFEGDDRPGGLIDKGTKGKRVRTVPLIEEVRPLIEKRLNAVGHDPRARIFTGPRGGRITTAVLRDATHWDEVVTQLGYEHLRRHNLRHTGLTWMEGRGVASDATFCSSREHALPAAQRAALRCPRPAGRAARLR